MCDDDIEREERAIYATAVTVLAPIVIVAIASYATFDGGATLCLVLTICAITLLVTGSRGRHVLPAARSRSRS